MLMICISLKVSVSFSVVSSRMDVIESLVNSWLVRKVRFMCIVL